MQKWKIKNQVDQHALRIFLECTARISNEISEIVAGQGTSDERGVTIPNAIRNISTGLRNIYLDGSGSLMKRCLEDPNIHPLKNPNPKAKTITATERISRVEADIVIADGSEHHVVLPEHDLKTIVRPLYGLTYNEDATISMKSPFDKTTHPIKFNKWMNQKVVMVDNLEYTAMEVLRIMASREGAHRDEQIPFATPVDIDEDKNERYRAISKVRFGMLSYLEVFSFFTGWYTVERIKHSLVDVAWSGPLAIFEGIRTVIGKCPNETTMTAIGVRNSASPMIMLGHEMEVRGDYSKGITTTMGIPGWD